MVTVADALAVLYPDAIPQIDYAVATTETGQTIAQWSPALGPQPTVAQLAAVTPEQVVAVKQQKAINATKPVLASDEPVPKAARAGSFALMISLQEARSKINELVAWANANGATIEPLVTGSTFQDALQDVAALLDAGVA